MERNNENSSNKLVQDNATFMCLNKFATLVSAGKN